MTQESAKRVSRTPEQIRRHYEIEKELANKLRSASKQQRGQLYVALYDELFRRVTDHPQLTQRGSPAQRAHAIRTQVKFVKPFVNQNVTFLEIGAGDCALSLEVAKFAKQVYAIDVSAEIAKTNATPGNFRLILSNGCSIPVFENSVHVAYSNQLMEHLHPDDALEQLQNIYRALAPGGIYLFVTPNRLSGPHDVSMDFDKEATGFHLKEYTIAELNTLLRQVGFSRIKAFVGARGTYVTFPVASLVTCERFLGILPSALRRSIAGTVLFRILLNIRLGAIK